MRVTAGRCRCGGCAHVFGPYTIALGGGGRPTRRFTTKWQRINPTLTLLLPLGNRLRHRNTMGHVARGIGLHLAFDSRTGLDRKPACIDLADDAR